MRDQKSVRTLVIFVVSTESLVAPNDNGAQLRADQPLKKPPIASANSEGRQSLFEELKRSGAAVNTAAFGTQVFISRRP